MGAGLLRRFAIVPVAAMLAGAAMLAPSAHAAPKSESGRAAARAKEAEAKADPRVWMIAKAEDTYVLRFGMPRVADPLFAMACQPGGQLIQFTVEVAAGKVRAGDGVALSLAAGKRRLELAASAFRGANDSRVVVEAAVALDARVLDLLAEGDTLVVRLPGATESYPLAGARAKLPDFRRVCLSGVAPAPDRR
ncbi:hypothetical protein ABLE93_06760 [Xanthobacter sp. KR7-65]|uniref:hypothetical protein n=1 Tax=Xanthobacter sp. KR7-65 TaxID=3156612 RepID=UPI0032B4FCF4